MFTVFWHNIETRLDEMRIKMFVFLIVEVTDVNMVSVMRKSRDFFAEIFSSVWANRPFMIWDEMQTKGYCP